MRTTHMGGSRDSHRDGKPANVIVSTTLTVEELILGIAQKDRKVIARFERLSGDAQHDLALHAFKALREMPEDDTEQRELKVTTFRCVREHLRLLNNSPEALRQLGAAIVSEHWQRRRQSGVLFSRRIIRAAVRPQCVLPSDEEIRRMFAPARTAPAALSASA